MPSFLGTTPRGEHWRVGIGGDGKGPALWPLETSFARAAETASECRSADFKLGVILVYMYFKHKVMKDI